MAYYLPSSGTPGPGTTPAELATPFPDARTIADLRVFWGPDICRLEYLVHLVDTGRIKDEVQGSLRPE